MTEYIDIINQWVIANQQHAWWVIFLIAFAESMIILGILVPGLPFMLMLGGLIATNVLDAWLVIFWCIVGAVVGDGLSFWIGKHYRYRILNMWPLSKHPDWVMHGEDFFTRWGGVSILIGRFFGPLRATIPALAGILGMTQKKFTAWNVVSAIIWAPAYLAPGFFLGWLADQGETGAWLALGLLITSMLGYWLWKQSRNKNTKDETLA
jgi:undecaprenyl-diphosphatase